jgi:hypothetical protein
MFYLVEYKTLFGGISRHIISLEQEITDKLKNEYKTYNIDKLSAFQIYDHLNGKSILLPTLALNELIMNGDQEDYLESYNCTFLRMP